MRRRELVRLSLAGAGVFAASCARDGRGERSLRVATSPYILNSGLYVAQEQGYFTDLGIDVDSSLPGSSSVAIPLLASGEIDAALFALSPALVNAVAAGAQIRIVAARGVMAPDCSTSPAFYWRRGEYPTGVEGFRQLRGKKVSITRPTTPSAFALDMVLDEVGMTVNDFELVYLEGAEAMAAARAGHIDGLLGFGTVDRDPTEIDQRLMVGLQLSDLFPMFQFSFVMFGERLLNSEPSLGADFLEAYFRGVRRFREGAMPDFLKGSALDFDESKPGAVCRTGISTDGAVNLSDLTEYIRWTRKRGLVEDLIEADELFDHRFLDLIAERSHESIATGSGGD